MAEAAEEVEVEEVTSFLSLLSVMTGFTQGRSIELYPLVTESTFATLEIKGRGPPLGKEVPTRE